MNKLKCIVLNTKGGVGKSTVAMQLLAPYIFNRFEQVVKFYELDNENDDASAFEASAIIEPHKIFVNKDIQDKLSEIICEDNHMILDIGANKTATAVLSALMEGGMIYAVNLVIIPLLDGEQDAINAIMTYMSIRDSIKKPKILFVLNRHNESRDIYAQFDIFLGDKRGFFDDQGLISYVKDEDKNIVFLTDSDVIKYARKFHLSVYELAHLNRDIDYELRVAIQEATDAKTIRFLGFKRSVQSDAMKYTNVTLTKAFEKIDEILQG
ncbi:Mrp/NBP35 family ATP-binding protein [bacterium]|nr:Mrp/NBP35 family ATP-binding protein [bacterium]MBU1882878.1 Mrp/NBP35 family ATP-binding protein [bacterium]